MSQQVRQDSAPQTTAHEQVIHDLRDQLRARLEDLKGEVGADAINLYVFDEHTHRFGLPFSLGLRDESTFLDANMLPRTDRIAGRVIRGKEPVFADNVAEYPDMNGAFARREGIASSAAVPLLYDNRALGIFFVNHRRPHAFTDADRRVLMVAAADLTTAIHESDVFAALREWSTRFVSDHSLRVAARLVAATMSLPAAIWLPARHSREMRIRAASDLPPDYVRDARAMLGDGGLVSKSLETGKPCQVRDLFVGKRAWPDKQAAAVGLRAALVDPIVVRERPGAVIQVFSEGPRSFDDTDLEKLAGLEEMVSATIEDYYRASESELLADFARTLSTIPDFDGAMEIVVKCAHDLTRADFCTVVLVDEDAETFQIASRFPFEGTPVSPRPRGLARSIIESGEAVKIDDTTKDPRVSPPVVGEGIRSLLGVRLQLEEERIGVLFADGFQIGQFTDRDVRLLQMVASQASVGLGWARVLLRPSREIHLASSEMLLRDVRLEKLCDEVNKLREFDYVAVQLVRRDENVVETVVGTGEAQAWAGLARHYLHEQEDIRDIQPDIVLAQPLRTEIIAGWDERFDRRIYEDHDHERFVRIFCPLAFVRGANGAVIKELDWDYKITVDKKDEANKRQHVVIEMHVPQPLAEERGIEIEVVGTVEVAFTDPERKKPVVAADAVALARLVTSQVHEIRRGFVSHVLECIVQRAMRVVRADAASLHFQTRPGSKEYIYEVSAGMLDRHFLKEHPPRHDGLGSRAIQEKRALYVPDPRRHHSVDELSRKNPGVWKRGVRAMAAVPLILDPKPVPGRDRPRNGVLYLHSMRPHRFTDVEMGWVRLFTDRAVEAIRQATTYKDARDRAIQLATLNDVAQSVVKELDQETLLRKISRIVLNVLAADVVTVYEYIAHEKDFVTPPAIAGRLLEEGPMVTKIYSNDAPTLLVEGNDDLVFVQPPDSVCGHPIFNKSGELHPTRDRAPFVIRERIDSAAGALLRVGEAKVGVMFINYRRPHVFTQEQKDLVLTLASTAAIAIRNRRALEKRQRDLRIITHQLRHPITSAVHRMTSKHFDGLQSAARADHADALAFIEDALTLCEGLYRSLAQEAGQRLVVVPDGVDLVAELKGLCKRIQAIRRRSLSFTFHAPDGLQTIRMDRGVFTSVMTTLIHNAISYADGGSRVVLRVIPESPGQMLTVEVQSTGQVIQPDETDLIFRKFRRGRNASGFGVGLGLWIARVLMRGVGGDLTIRLDPQVSNRSVFVVQLPPSSPEGC